MGECLGGCRGQRIEAKLGVVSFAHPAVVIFGTVANEQEHTGGRQTLNQAILEHLRLTVDPVEALDDQEQGLDLALPYQQMRDGVHDPLTALGRIEALPPGVFNRHLQEHQECGQDRLQGCLQRLELVGDLVTSRLQIIPRVELNIGLEQVDDREIRASLAVGVRTGLEAQLSMGQVGAHELVAQAGLAYAGLPHHTYYLPPALLHLHQEVAQGG